MNIRRMAAYGLLASLPILVFASFYSAVLFDDPYLIKRYGASITGLSAIIVLYQVAVETAIERWRAANSTQPDQLTSVNREFVERVNARRAKVFHNERLRIVVVVAAFAVVGETLHGWGDVLYYQLVPSEARASFSSGMHDSCSPCDNGVRPSAHP
jgi:hypothetical protein